MKALFLWLCFAVLLQWARAGQASPAADRLAGESHRLRIVSLAPSNTELVYCLQAESQLVGVSTYCDYPKDARTRPHVGSFTSVNMERLCRLKPDLVLLVSGQEVLASMLTGKGFKVLILANNRLTDISHNLRTLGEITGRQEKSSQLAESFARALDDLASVVARARVRPRVFYCVWPRPLLTAGGTSFLNQEITAAGGINIAADLGKDYPHYSAERLVLAKPDVVIFPHEARNQSFLGKPPWSILKALRAGNAHYLPPPATNDLARPTLRAIDGIHWLAVHFHPELKGDLDRWLARAGSSLAGAGLSAGS